MKDSPVIEQIHLSDRPTKYDVHFHNSYEVIYIIRGRIRMMLHHDRVYEAGPESLVFINNLEEHSTKVMEEPYKRYFLILFPPAMDKLIKNPHLLSVYKNRPPSFCNVFDVSPISKTVERIFSSLYFETKTPDVFSREMVDCLLRKLMIAVYRNNRADFPSLSKSISPQIYSIQAFIDHNFSTPISLSGLAEQYYVSVSHISHSFKKLTGYSPMQYLLLNRLSYSKVMLSSTDLAISEVAYHSGFTDVNNFIRAFKAYYGNTPGNFRKLEKKLAPRQDH